MIGVYKNVRISLEKMFALPHGTYRHSAPRMMKTFKKIGDYMKKHDIHTAVAGRRAKYEIPDAIDLGINRLWTAANGAESADASGEADTSDVVADGEDGDLDV